MTNKCLFLYSSLYLHFSLSLPDSQVFRLPHVLLALKIPMRPANTARLVHTPHLTNYRHRSVMSPPPPPSLITRMLTVVTRRIVTHHKEGVMTRGLARDWGNMPQ